MKEELFKKVAEIIAANNRIPVESITMNSTFQELGMDSLDALTLVNDLEKFYDLAVPNMEAIKIHTVREAVESLEVLYTAQKTV